MTGCTNIPCRSRVSLQASPIGVPWRASPRKAFSGNSQTLRGPGRACSVSREEAQRRGLKVAERAPEDGSYEWVNRNTGEVEQIPTGIDPGWNYAPGEAWLRSMTPEFLEDWPSNVAQIPQAAPSRPLPPPRTLPADMLMPEGLQPEAYVQTFMERFGAELGDHVVFEDRSGERVLVSDLLFRDRHGSFKVLKRGREVFVKVLAETILAPDEIWVSLDPLRTDPGKWKVFRRYVARFNVEGRESPAVSVFEFGARTWFGVTSFAPDSIKELQRRRRGVLLYRRDN